MRTAVVLILQIRYNVTEDVTAIDRCSLGMMSPYGLPQSVSFIAGPHSRFRRSTLVARARIGVNDDNRHYLEAAVAAIGPSTPHREALTEYRWNDRFSPTTPSRASSLPSQSASRRSTVILGHTAAYRCYDTTQPDGVESIPFFGAVAMQTCNP